MNLISKTGGVDDDDDDICQYATQLAKFFFGTHDFDIITYNSVMFVRGCVRLRPEPRRGA